MEYFFQVKVDNATYRSAAAQVVQLVLADEDGELVQVQHVVGVRCDLVWKEGAAKKKASPHKMTLLFSVINYFPPPLLYPKRNQGCAPTKKRRRYEAKYPPGVS